MLDKKIRLNNAIRNFISEERKFAKKNNPDMTADGISIEIGRTQSWLSQVENGRLKSVKTNDLIKVFSVIRDVDYQNAKKYLDDEICYINAKIKNGIIDENGKIISHSKYLFFIQIRGHLLHATDLFNDAFSQLLEDSVDDIRLNLTTLVKRWLDNIVYWIKRAFSDVGDLFNDEVSMANLYSIVETSYKILSQNNEHYGVNIPTCTIFQVHSLKEKLNDTHIVRPKTVIKTLNEYTDRDIVKVIQYFSPEDYMKWNNHQTYMGHEPFPMLVNYKESYSDNDCFVLYDDVTHQTGLSEKQYLHIIRQLCFHFDLIYKQCKYYINTSQEYEEESNEYSEKVEQLEKKISDLKEQLEKLSSNQKSPQE